MKNRKFYLVAYDISDPRRLQKAGRAVKAYLTGGQKSVAECWMLPSEREKLLQKMEFLITGERDRLHCFRLDPRQKPVFLGVAKRTEGQPFIIT